MKKILPMLPEAPRVKVFRTIERILRTNPILRQTVREPNWQTWDGSSDDILDFAYAQSPAIRLTPMPRPDIWWSPDAVTEPLVVIVTLEVNTTNVDDIANLWYAVVLALYPKNPQGLSPSPRQKIADQLRAAGAQCGVFDFIQPAFAPAEPSDEADGGRLIATGQIKIDVTLELDP